MFNAQIKLILLARNKHSSPGHLAHDMGRHLKTIPLLDHYAEEYYTRTL
jgi:hypothetical protein